jgi:hypothetical protein
MHRRPHLIAVVLVGIAAAITGAIIQRSAPVYTESATVLFALPARSAAATYSWHAGSLIATGAVISQVVMSPRVRSQIEKAGGTARYNLALVNLYNEDYPDYGYPEALLTASSSSASNTHQTFLIARKKLVLLLARRQRMAGARPGDEIVARLTDDSGPVAEAGSLKRSLAALALLALVCGCTLWNALSPAGIHRRA